LEAAPAQVRYPVLEEARGQQRLLAPALLGADVAEEPEQQESPAAMRIVINHRLLSACRIPVTRQTRPAAERTAPTTSKGLVGSGATGSSIPRLRTTMIATTSAWNTKAARQLIAVVMRLPRSGPAAAPTPPIPLITPNAFARDVMSAKSIVVKM
jgi:hypothetical protein